MNEMIDQMVTTAAALSDPSRIRLVAALMSGRLEERCVCELTELLQLAPSTVSKHLLILRQAGLIEGRKQGRWMYYRPHPRPGVHAGGALSWIRRARMTDPVLLNDAEELSQIAERLGLPCCDSPDCSPEQPSASATAHAATGDTR